MEDMVGEDGYTSEIVEGPRSFRDDAWTGLSRACYVGVRRIL